MIQLNETKSEKLSNQDEFWVQNTVSFNLRTVPVSDIYIWIHVLLHACSIYSQNKKIETW